jgi:hypothetical protein
MKNQLSKYYTYGILACWAIACFVFFQGFYSYHFFFKEQTQLFLLSSDYLNTYFNKPAWLACMTGDFITQFYYYKFAGAIILTIVLLILGDLTRRSMEKCGCKKIAFWIALVVMTLEAICHFSVNFSLSSTFAIIGVLILFLLYTLTQKEWLRWTTTIIFTALAYWFFGYGCFIFVLLVIICDIKKKIDWLNICLLAIAFIVIPLLRGYYLLTWQDSLIYPGIGKFHKPNFILETILSLDNEFYFGNTQKVIKLAKKSNLKLSEISYYYNLAQAKKGTIADSLLYFYQPLDEGLFMKSGPDVALIDLYIESELYNTWGDMTFDEHSAILANVFSPNNRNVRMIKRLAEVNLINNDTTAAMKYLRILNKTFVYHKWAKCRIPGKQTERVKREIHEKQKFINNNDTFRDPNENRRVLNGLLQSNPKNTIALDYLLCSELLRKDIGGFKNDYDIYCIKTGLPRMKPIYQEALMIYLAGKNAKPEEWAKYRLSPEIGRKFKDYTKIYVKSNGNRAALIGRFRYSYWFYFHFASLK